MLFNGGFRESLLQPFDIGRDMQRLDIDELAELMLIAPGKELEHRSVIGHAGILVADGRREEFEEASGGVVTGVVDHRRHDEAPRGRFDRRRWLCRD